MTAGEDHVVFTLTGKEGTQHTTDQFTDSGLTITREIRSKHFEVPLKWQVNYRCGGG